jgi:hypothetical protein
MFSIIENDVSNELITIGFRIHLGKRPQRKAPMHVGASKCDVPIFGTESQFWIWIDAAKVGVIIDKRMTKLTKTNLMKVLISSIVCFILK